MAASQWAGTRASKADWVGGRSRLLAPLVEALHRHVMSAGKLHADDTPVPVLAPGNGKTKMGPLRTYVRDDLPAGDSTPPAVWLAYSPDRRGEHPRQHLRRFSGILQADAYLKQLSWVCTNPILLKRNGLLSSNPAAIPRHQNAAQQRDCPAILSRSVEMLKWILVFSMRQDSERQAVRS